jgi:steroid delta-isomerase-like uncharacterized protein
MASTYVNMEARRPVATMEATTEFKAKARRLAEDGWNKGNLSAFDEWYASNVAFHHPTNPQKDRAAVKKYCIACRTSYPDLRVTLHDLMAAEGDKLVTRWTIRGTFVGGAVTVGRPPAGKHITFTGITISRFERGKVVEEWVEGDYLGYQRQLMG